MAITFGNTGSFGASSGAFNNNGNYLLVAISETANTVTGITYNGVAMTQIGTSVHNTVSGRYIWLWGLLNPPQGSNTVAISGGANFSVGCLSLSGISFASPFSGVATNDVTSPTPSVTVTTTQANAYVICTSLIRDFSSVGSGTTSALVINGDNNNQFFRSTAVVASPGAFTININSTGSESSFIAAGFNPAPPLNSAFLLKMI